MGLFSYDCRACGHPLLCSAATTKGVNTWMRLGIVIFSNGNVFSGEYDGYGRLGSFDGGGSGFQLGDGSVYHQHCHEALGKPMHFVGRSAPSLDQGWFFDEGDHSMASPLDDKAVEASLAPVGEMKVADITLKRHAVEKAEREFYEKEKAILQPDCPKCHFDTAFVVQKGADLMVRCPNRGCNNLYSIPGETQGRLLMLYVENPNQRGLWDDDEVNQDMAGIRSAKSEIRKHTEDLKTYQGKVGVDDDEKAYFEREVAYHQKAIEEAKQRIHNEEKRLQQLAAERTKQ